FLLRGPLSSRVPARRPELRGTTRCKRNSNKDVVAGKEASTVLVLTRRENEKILLPDVGVTVELMAVTGNRARLGISAPDNIRIPREEVAANQDAIKQALARMPRDGSRPSRETVDATAELVHAIRNRLNAALLAAETVRLQIDAGQLAETSAS